MVKHRIATPEIVGSIPILASRDALEILDNELEKVQKRIAEKVKRPVSSTG